MKNEENESANIKAAHPLAPQQDNRIFEQIPVRPAPWSAPTPATAADVAQGFTDLLPLTPVRVAPGEYDIKSRDGRTLWRMDGAALADWTCASVNGYDAAINALPRKKCDRCAGTGEVEGYGGNNIYCGLCAGTGKTIDVTLAPSTATTEDAAPKSAICPRCNGTGFETDSHTPCEWCGGDGKMPILSTDVLSRPEPAPAEVEAAKEIYENFCGVLNEYQAESVQMGLDSIARHIARPIRGCATDDQYTDVIERATTALTEGSKAIAEARAKTIDECVEVIKRRHPQILGEIPESEKTPWIAAKSYLEAAHESLVAALQALKENHNPTPPTQGE